MLFMRSNTGKLQVVIETFIAVGQILDNKQLSYLSNSGLQTFQTLQLKSLVEKGRH